MVIDAFPPIEDADENGLLAIGGDLDCESLLLAYKNGIFPWPISTEHPLAWFSPDPRGLLFLNKQHVPKSFAKFLKNCNWTIRFNTRFHEVIQRCAFANNRKDQEGTWITPYVIKSYIDFFEQGHAFSVETFDGDDLIGGMYGVKIGRYISGESMFYLKSNASKFALYHLLEVLKKNNIEWLDTQMVTSLTGSFGAEEIDRNLFLELHSKEVNKDGFNFS